MKYRIVQFDPQLLGEMFKVGTRIISPDGREVEITKGIPPDGEVDSGQVPMFWSLRGNVFEIRVRSEEFEDVACGDMPANHVVELRTVAGPIEVSDAQ